jgi:integrase
VRSRIAESALLTLADYARHRLATILDDTELATLFAHLKERPLYMPVLLAAFTGMRRGEVLALRWSDVDLERAELEVRQVVELVGRKMSFKDPKTERSRMTISLPDRLVQELRTYRKKQWEQSFKRGLGRFPLLFPTWEGKVWNPSHFTKAFSREVEAAKPRHVTFHGLRHPHHSLTS